MVPNILVVLKCIVIRCYNKEQHTFGKISQGKFVPWLRGLLNPGTSLPPCSRNHIALGVQASTGLWSYHPSFHLSTSYQSHLSQVPFSHSSVSALVCSSCNKQRQSIPKAYVGYIPYPTMYHLPFILKKKKRISGIRVT